MLRRVALGWALTFLAAALPASQAQAQAQDAKSFAQDLLDRGAKLFNAKDAAVMAATYLQDAEFALVSRSEGASDFNVETTRGREAIERYYAKLYSDSQKPFAAKNVVEYAHFIGANLLVIHGNFTTGTNPNDNPMPFIQVRAKQDGKWLIMSLQLFLVSE